MSIRIRLHNPIQGMVKFRKAVSQLVTVPAKWVKQGAAILSADGSTLTTNYTNFLFKVDKPLLNGKKYYVEINFTKSVINASGATESRNITIGWAQLANIGFFNFGHAGTVCWYPDGGGVYLGGNNVATTTAFVNPTNPTVMMAVDVAAGKYWFGSNGVWGGGATVADIAAGLKPTYTNTAMISRYLAFTNNYDVRATQTLEIITGQKPFKYTMPTGFQSISTTA